MVAMYFYVLLKYVLLIKTMNFFAKVLSFSTILDMLYTLQTQYMNAFLLSSSRTSLTTAEISWHRGNALLIKKLYAYPNRKIKIMYINRSKVIVICSYSC